MTMFHGRAQRTLFTKVRRTVLVRRAQASERKTCYWPVTLGSSGQESSSHGTIIDSHYQEMLGQGKTCWTPR